MRKRPGARGAGPRSQSAQMCVSDPHTGNPWHQHLRFWLRSQEADTLQGSFPTCFPTVAKRHRRHRAWCHLGYSSTHGGKSTKQRTTQSLFEGDHVVARGRAGSVTLCARDTDSSLTRGGASAQPAACGTASPGSLQRETPRLTS